jgi:integrase
MGRPAKGAVRWNPATNVWEVRVTLADGTRSKPKAMIGLGLVPCLIAPDAPPTSCACTSCVNASETGQRISRKMRAGAAVDAATTETVSEWFGRYYLAAERGTVGTKNRGKPQSAVAGRRSRFKTWIEPAIGTKAMTAVTSADLRRLVQTLDEAIMVRTRFYIGQEDAEPTTSKRTGRKPGLSEKTAGGVWSEVTSGFDEAVTSKLDTLRILTVNPAIGVRPPTTGDAREQAALYPAEVVTLLSCADVPRERRRVYWGALYTGLRRSELARVTAADVNLVHGVIIVRGKKTNAARREVPIEPALLPLLAVLVKARKTGALFDVPRADGKGGTSDLVKRDLERAHLERADLSRDDADHMPFTFHGLRHTAVTHWAVSGKPQTWLLVVAGHTSDEMTRRYLDKAAVVRGQYGQPHPMLAAEVVADLLSDLPIDDEPTTATALEVVSEPASGLGTEVLETSAEPAGTPVEVSEEFWSSNGILADADKSKTGNPEGFPVILTVALRPQWELNPRSRRERPVS